MHSDLLRIVLRILRDMDHPRALTVAILLRNGEWEQLTRLSCVPSDYHRASDYFSAASATDLLRKFDGFPGLSEARAKAAHDSFEGCELQCAKTNLRLSRLTSPTFYEPEDLPLIDFVDRARTVIKRVLGRLPDDLSGRHGPGTTYGDKGSFATIPHKMSSQPTVCSQGRIFLPFWNVTLWSRGLVNDYPHRSDPLTVRGNRFATVPKDSVKDRGIGIEPSINVFYQLGVGSLIRKRLLTVGIDLENNQDLHAHLAQKGSLDGTLATIDLSNASDTLSYELVRLLLPSEWFSLLDSLRSPCTLIGGRWRYLEKFSSMGNGFTFELETLIFWALARASGVEEEDLKVYGDDIIVPSLQAVDVVASLQYFGFTPNSRKTFLTGEFRESCGGDFYSGVPVRPFFLKSEPANPVEWIAFHNGIRDLFLRLRGYCPIGTLRAITDCVPTMFRLYGPSRLGDSVIHTRDRRLWRTRTEFCITQCKTLRVVGLKHHKRPVDWPFLTALGSVLCGLEANSRIGIRGSPSGFKTGWVSVS